MMTNAPLRNVDSFFFEQDLAGNTITIVLAIFLGWSAIPVLGVSILFFFATLTVGAYLFTRSVDWSAPLKLADDSAIDHVRVFEHHGEKYLGRDFFLSTYILLPKSWRNDKEEDPETFQCNMTHEVGHCHKMDLSQITSWYLFRILASVISCVMAGYAVALLTNAEQLSTSAIFLVIVFSTLIFAHLYVIFQTPNLILSFEHNADEFAWKKLGEPYIEFIDDKDCFSKHRVTKKPFIENLLHPSWSRRKQFLLFGSEITPSKAMIEGFFSFIFLATIPILFIFLKTIPIETPEYSSILLTFIGLLLTTFFVHSIIDFLFDAGKFFSNNSNYFVIGFVIPLLALCGFFITEWIDVISSTRIIFATLVAVFFLYGFIFMIRATTRFHDITNVALSKKGFIDLVCGLFLVPMILILPSVFSNLWVILFAVGMIVYGIIQIVMMNITAYAHKAAENDPELDQIFTDLPAFGAIKRMGEVHPESVDAQNAFLGSGSGYSEFGRRMRNFSHRQLLRMHGAFERKVDRSVQIDKPPLPKLGSMPLKENFKVLASPNSILGKWYMGVDHPSYKNVLSADIESEWEPAPGYVWVDRIKSWEVRWKPGKRHSLNEHLVASEAEQKWLNGRNQADRFHILEQNEKLKDLARKESLPSPPNTNGALFTPEELDIYVNKKTNECYIFHGKSIEYNEIDYLEYHMTDCWIVVVQKDGRRLDLGVHAQWLIRPYWSEADDVSIVLTHDGESIDGTIVPLRRIDVTGNWLNETSNVNGMTNVAAQPEAKLVDAPDTDGVLFKPDELDIYANKVNNECFIFHGKVIEYDEIDFLEYHTQHYWVAVVLKNRRRLDLGTHIQWLLRPYWREADEVSFCRTKDQETIDSRIFPIRQID